VIGTPLEMCFTTRIALSVLPTKTSALSSALPLSAVRKPGTTGSGIVCLWRLRSRRQREPLPYLRQLKAEMAAAHPDRGGSEAAFIEARKRCLAVKRECRNGSFEGHALR
jgi:hypothetical protein